MTAFFGRRQFLSCAAAMNGPRLRCRYWPIDRSDARTNWLSSRLKDTSGKTRHQATKGSATCRLLNVFGDCGRGGGAKRYDRYRPRCGVVVSDFFWLLNTNQITALATA